MLMVVLVGSGYLGPAQQANHSASAESGANTDTSHTMMTTMMASDMPGMTGAMMATAAAATENDDAAAVQNKPMSKISDGIKLDFEAQPAIHMYDLAQIQMHVTDAKSSARLTHVDWAITVKDPEGNVVYKTTTVHSHVGVTNFKVAFPKAGQNTVSLTVSSIGKTMMGMEVEPQGRTHTMISGVPTGFKTDPENDFGARTFEFPVFVRPLDQSHTLPGTVPGTAVNVDLTTTASKIVAGQPTTFVITVTRANDTSMIRHPDLQVTVMDSSTGYVLSQSAPVEDMMTMHGAIHGHTGVMTLTPNFPMAGNYVIDVDLQPSPLSNYFWGHASTRFNVLVTEPGASATAPGTPNAPQPANDNNGGNAVNILGLEAPFFTPNVLNVKAGTTVKFVNTDGNAHTVSSVKKGTVESDGMFDSGVLTAGKTFAYTFSKPGTYEYICLIHTHMRGVVKVS